METVLRVKDSFKDDHDTEEADRSKQGNFFFSHIVYQFGNGISFRQFWWKDVPFPIPSFIHSRYTVVSQNSILGLQ